MIEQPTVRLLGMSTGDIYANTILDFSIEDLLKELIGYTDVQIEEFKSQYGEDWTTMAISILVHKIHECPKMCQHRNIPIGDTTKLNIGEFKVYEMVVFVSELHKTIPGVLFKDRILHHQYFPDYRGHNMAEQLIVRLTGMIGENATVLDFTMEEMLKRLCDFTDERILESKTEQGDAWNILATVTLHKVLKTKPTMILLLRHSPNRGKIFTIYEMPIFLHDESEKELRKNDTWCMVRFPQHKENPYVE